MSTENTPSPQAMVTSSAAPPMPDEIRIVSRSNLFYWWPVWAVGYLMALITFINGTHLVTVPAGTELVEKAAVTAEGQDAPQTDRTVLVAPAERGNRVSEPGVRISSSKSPGVVYAFILLLVITITNIHMRGLWSVIVSVVLVALVVILALAGAWDWILEQLNILDIRISMGGYIFISTVLLIIWLVVFLFFDPQVYMVFTPGAFRVRQEIGEGETQYDTRGMTLQKVRSDFFRHWILGLGSGDLIVRTTGAQAHEFHLVNVLFVGRKVRLIEDMLRRTGAVNN